jgi:hypothetical protein
MEAWYSDVLDNISITIRPLQRAAAHGGGELDGDTQISRLIEVSRSSRPNSCNRIRHAGRICRQDAFLITVVVSPAT